MYPVKSKTATNSNNRKDKAEARGQLRGIDFTLKVINCPIDSVYPQPGINDYKKLEYIFEQKTMTLSTIMDLYGRKVTPDNGTDLIDVVEVYYLNKDRVVGHLVFTKDGLTVLSNDVEWV